MAVGPVQLIVLGFEHPEFHGEIIAELERLRASDTVRVIDSLAVYKDSDSGKPQHGGVGCWDLVGSRAGPDVAQPAASRDAGSRA
jgi:hypothetical protein